MQPASVTVLLGRVRRRLWRAALMLAVRRALWSSAALMLLAGALRLAGTDVDTIVLALALALPWALLGARVAMQRPGDAACALWADRELDGQTAFTTWLELRHGSLRGADAQAAPRLERWLDIKVPDALRRLARPAPSAALMRPLLVAAVCGALALLVLALPEAGPRSRTPAAAAPAPAGGDAASPMATATAEAEQVSDVARALRASRSTDTARPGEGGGAAAAGAAASDGGRESRPPQAAAGHAAGAATGPAPTTEVRVDAAGPGTQALAAAGGGREAGASRDERADVGVSRPLQGEVGVQRSEAPARRRVAERRADVDEHADYEADAARRPAAAAAGSEPAAATAPPATDHMQLTATEASYVRAWMKASARQR